jgi:hypothetical protein
VKSKKWFHQWNHIIVGSLCSQQFLQHFGERLNDRSGLAWKSKLLSVVGWLGPWVGPHCSVKDVCVRWILDLMPILAQGPRSLMIQVDSECSNQGSKSDPEERDDHHSKSNSKIPWISMIHLDLSENWIPAKSRFTMVYHHFACTTVIYSGCIPHLCSKVYWSHCNITGRMLRIRATIPKERNCSA